jgi:hypothetical protein
MKTDTKRSTIYLNAALYRALRLKAAETDNSISELVNQAVSYSLAEDALDIAAVEERKKEPSISFENVLKQLKKDGKI